MQKLVALLALCIASTIFADLGRCQPVTGGPATGGTTTGRAPTGGNTTGGGVTGGNVTGGNVGANVGEERRFIVEFQNFIVLDETGCDYCGSDEVSFIIRSADYALHSSEYGNLDSPTFYYSTPIPHRFKRCASRPSTAITKPIGNGNAIRKVKPPRFLSPSPPMRMTAQGLSEMIVGPTKFTGGLMVDIPTSVPRTLILRRERGAG